PLPNLEDPKHPLRSTKQRPSPAGFGFIAPHWEWRRRHAGTYDEGWTRDRMPLLPQDFDRRFFNAAHPDLISPGYLRGGEPVEVVNGSPRGGIALSLPHERLEGVVMMKDQTRHRVGMSLDTVVIDTDEHRLTLLWRGALPVYGQVHDLLWSKVQHSGPASGAA